MAKKLLVFCTVLFFLALPALMADGPKGTISYKIDGKPFTFTEGKMEYHFNSPYLSLTYEKVEVFTFPGIIGKKGVDTGITIQVGGDEPDYPGLHQSNTSDEIPTFFSWYELILDPKTKKAKDVKQYTLSLDSGDQSKMYIKIKIDSFGPKGSIVTGTFSGKLFDEDGVLHSVTDGVFSVPRVDVED